MGAINLTFRASNQTFGDMHLSGSPIAPIHLVRASTLAGYAALVAEMGGDAPALWREAGLAARDLRTPDEDRYLSHAKVELLLERTAEALDCPHFALLLGQRLSLSMLGLIGFVMQQSPTVGAALAELQAHFYLLVRGSALELQMHGERHVRMYFVVHDTRALPSVRCTAELCLSAGLQIMRRLCGAHWSPLEVGFAHARPSQIKRYRRWFGAPVQFDQEQDSFLFSADMLRQPIDRADPALGRVLNTYLTLLDAKHSDDPVAQIRELITRALATGGCSAEKVAAFLGVHRRTLHRMLAVQGTTFKQVLEQVRKDRAARALAESDISVTALAHALCYSDTSALSRAFQKWYGMSPRAWRQSHNGGKKRAP